jgi:hypothetical protein
MSLQVQDIINGALRLLGVLAAGELGSPEEISDGIISLNEVLDGWNINRLDIFYLRNDVYNLSSGTQAYTLGVGGSLSGPRPVSIKNVAAIHSSGLAIPMDVVSSEDWAAITEKSVAGTLPRKLYCDFAFPQANVLIWPVPSGTPQISIYSWSQFTTYVNPTDAFTMPPGYEIAVRYNLAVAMAPEYGRPASQELVGLAMSSLQALQALNRPPVEGAADEQIARAQVAQQVAQGGGGLAPPQPPNVPMPRT